MSQELDAAKIVQNVENALGTPDVENSTRMLSEVNNDLQSLSQPERDLVQNSLALKGLLPDLALSTGIVNETDYIKREELAAIGHEQGTNSLEGMAAGYLARHIGSNAMPLLDFNSDAVAGFDIRQDLALDLAQARREFPGLLEYVQSDTPNSEKDGLAYEDVTGLLERSDLSEEQKEALGLMKEQFDYMKTPRGVWRIADWSTPRITAESLNEFADTALPLGIRPQLETAEAKYAARQEIEKLAREAEQARKLEIPQSEQNEGQESQTTESSSLPEQDVVPPLSILEDIEASTAESVDESVSDNEPNHQENSLENGVAPEYVESGEPISIGVHEMPSSMEAGRMDQIEDQIEDQVQDHIQDSNTDLAVDNLPSLQLTMEENSEVDSVSVQAESTDEQESINPESNPVETNAGEFAFEREQTAKGDDSNNIIETTTEDTPLVPDLEIEQSQSTIEEEQPEAKPESHEREERQEFAYEVVDGDNLWKIARSHLKEQSGGRPSNQEVLSLVNQIVELNQIANPDLIYPGQKFIIPTTNNLS